MVTFAVADLVESACDFAVTAKLPAVAPAVKRPDDVIVPPVALQVTAGLDVPVTVAVNCCVAPAITEAVVGETLTLTPGTVEPTTMVSIGRLLCGPVVATGLTTFPVRLLIN